MKKTIIILMLCMPIWIHAQSWLNGESIILENHNLIVNAYAQKIKAFKSDILIGITKQHGGNYHFTALFDGNSIIHESDLNNPNLHVSDFCILKDWIYFCGKMDLSGGNFMGIIGRFKIDDFLDDGYFSYEITQIQNTENLTNLVTYNTDNEPNVTHIVAIGDNASQGCMVCLDDRTNPDFDYTVLECPQFIGIKEVCHDITFDEKYVIMLSHAYPSNHFILRYAYKEHPELHQTHQQGDYHFPNHSFICTFDRREYPLHLSLLPNDILAVSATAADTQDNYFTMINFINVGDLTNPPTNQVIYHSNKMIRTLEMEYSVKSDSLLLLESTDLFGNGWVESVSFVNPWIQSPYPSRTKFLPNLDPLNHLCLVPDYGYAVAGSEYSTGNQFYWIKKVNNNQYSCEKFETINIDATAQGNVSSYSSLVPVITTIPCQWNGNNAGNNPMQVNIECQN